MLSKHHKNHFNQPRRSIYPLAQTENNPKLASQVLTYLNSLYNNLLHTQELPPEPSTFAAQVSELIESIRPDLEQRIHKLRIAVGLTSQLPPPPPPTGFAAIKSAAQSAIYTLSEGDYTHISTLLLTVLFSIFLFMSWGNRFGSWGRFSPFGRPSPGFTGEVSDGDFSYITNEDLANIHAMRAAGAHAAPDHGREKDVLIFKNKKVSYPVHFPAGSIDSGALKVGAVRAAAARKMEIGAGDADRVKMFYKGRNLKDDSRAARDEGLRSGVDSEILCVVGDAPISRPEDSEDEEEEEDIANGGTDSPKDGSAKKRRKRGGKKNKKKGGPGGNLGGSGTATPTSGYSTPTINPDATYVPTHAPPPRPSSSAGGGSSKPAAPQQTAQQKLDALASTFHTKFVPECVQFTQHPPTDPAARKQTAKRLEETMMQQILLKLDAVETEGDPDARAKRKALVREVDSMMKALDDAGK